MRELKFRAKFRNISNGKKCWQYALLQKGKITDPIINLSAYVQITEWEQLTGLRDKQGKEIYEGDILKITNPDYQVQKMEMIGVVEMGWFQWQVSIKKISSWENYSVDKPSIEGYNMAFYTLAAGKEYEVAGNIHQDPELLNQ